MGLNKIGRYEIRSEIGRGGMATVYKANDPNFGREVAIKVLPHEFLHDPLFRARFEREARIIALLEHPAIVPVYDFGEEDEQPYIVMRYMSGGSLADRLARGRMLIAEVVKMISTLAPALDTAHRRGVVHRDLKPGNILFDQYENPFISDFGIARLSHASGASLTGAAILGTPTYMSPELIQGNKDLDGRSDIYALGVILFQMLTGKVPYHSDTPAKLMLMHILDPIPTVTAFRGDVPAAFDSMIAKAMAKDPEERFSTATEMASQLSRAASTPASPGAVAVATKETMVAQKAPQNPPSKPPVRPERQSSPALAAQSMGSGHPAVPQAKPITAPPPSTPAVLFPGAAAPSIQVATPTPLRPSLMGAAARPVTYLPAKLQGTEPGKSAVKPKKIYVPIWAWIIGGLSLLIILASLIVGGIALVSGNKQPVAPQPTPVTVTINPDLLAGFLRRGPAGLALNIENIILLDRITDLSTVKIQSERYYG
jgi:serine/threonine protein kinase